MTTKIQDTAEGYGPHRLMATSDDAIDFYAKRGADEILATMDRTEFFDAVRDGLGVLLITKADLPKVEVDSLGYLTAWAPGKNERRSADVDVDNLRQRGYALLAIADHAQAHPPVDEQQVEALVTLLNETSDGHAQSAPNIARRLIATGKVTVQS